MVLQNCTLTKQTSKEHSAYHERLEIVPNTKKGGMSK